MGSWFDDWIYSHLFTINNQLRQLTVNDCLRLALFLAGLRVSSLLRDWLGSDLRIGHFFSFRCPLVNTSQLNTQLLNCVLNSLTNKSLEFEVEVTLHVTVSQSVSLGVEPHLGLMTRYILLFDNYGLVFFFCGAPSLTRGRVCRLYMLLALASAVFLGPESLGPRDHILLFQIWDFPFRRCPCPFIYCPSNRVFAPGIEDTFPHGFIPRLCGFQQFGFLGILNS
jgi:hypothetical protein